MQQAPWERLGGAPPPQAQPQAAPQLRAIPRVIQGPPREPPPQTPVNEARDSVGLTRDRQALEAERIRLERERLQFLRDQRVSNDPAGDSGVDQRRQAGFFLRAARANNLYERTPVEPRSVVGQTLADAFPRLGNVSASSERQQAEAAQRDFIAATLRYESGAAIPPSEWESQRQIYFPQPGDTVETTNLKAQLRRNAMDALQRSAGQAGNGILPDPDPMAVVDAMVGAAAPGARVSPLLNQAAPGGGIAPGSAAAPVENSAPEALTIGNGLPGLTAGERSRAAGREELGRGDTLSPEARAAADRVSAQMTALARRGATADQIDAWLAQQGLPPLPPESRRMHERYQGMGARHPGFLPNYQTNVRTQDEIAGDVAADLLDPGGADEAFVAGALDTASMGFPALANEQYRQRMGDLRERNPVASIAGSVAGGLAAPVAGLYGRAGIGAGMSIPQMSARTAAAGGIYGFNSSGGDPVNALVGGAIGGAAPGAFNLAGRGVRGTYNALTGRAVNYADPDARAIAQALNEENIPGSRPLLDPGSRDRMAYLESNLGSNAAIRTPLEATRDALESRAGALAGPGTVEELGTMGQRIQQAGERYIRRSGGVATRMYDRAAQMAGDTPIVAREAVAELDDQLARLGRLPNSNKGEISFLQGLRADLVDDAGNLRPLSVGDIRDLRTGLRGRVSENNLTFSQVEGRVLGILGRAADDIERDLGGAAAPAVRAYRRADRFYAERASEIREVVQRVIGARGANLGGEKIMARVRAMASDRGNSEGLSRLWGKLSREEQQDAAATIAETAGRRTADEPFSPQQLVTWARTLSPAARRTIFGPDGAQSISNLVTVSKALQATQARLNNSRSGMVRNWSAALGGLVRGGPVGAGLGLLGGGSALTSGAAGLALGAATTAAGAGIRKLSARALMNPDLSRWLAAGPRAGTAEAIRRHIDRLQTVARANPAISQEITGLRQALMNAVNDNAPQAGRLAASPNEGPDNAEQ
jgi:hypothetical protein